MTNHNKRIGRFAAIGVINTVIDFGLLFVFGQFMPALAANIISTSSAFIFSFVANKKFTFESSSQNIIRELSLFIIVTLSGLWILQSLIIWVSQPIFATFLHNDNLALLVSKLVATVASLTWNYTLYSKVVFRESKSHPS